MTEEWRPVVGFPDYEVSNFGRVRSLDSTVWYGPRVGFGLRKGRILKSSVDGNGYLTVRLSGKKTAAVHRLVGEAFLGPLPKGKETRHLDGNRVNPHLDNLQYGTRSENHQDSYIHGTRNVTKNVALGRKTRDTKDRLYGRKYWTDGWRNGIPYSKAFDL